MKNYQVKGKINLYTVLHEIEDVKRTILNKSRVRDLEDFRGMDYTEFIGRPMSAYEKAWKYNKAYYSVKDLSTLYEVAQRGGYSKSLSTFKTLATNPDRQKELWIYEIETVFIFYLESIDHYISCDGTLLTKKKLTRIKGNPYNSRILMTMNGEQILFNKAATVLNRFTESDFQIGENDILYLDGFYGNCGLENLVLKS